MGVGDTKEGDEENVSSEVKDVDNVRDEDTISLEDGHEFNDYMKDSSNDEEKSNTDDDAIEQEDDEVEKAVNSLDIEPLNQQDSASSKASAEETADAVSDEANTGVQQEFTAELDTAADNTKVNDTHQSQTYPEDHMEFQDDYVSLEQKQLAKIQDPFNNNLEVVQNSSNDNLLQEKSGDSENIYLELTSGEHLSLPEVPELSFPELPPDNLNVKPAKKHEESNDQNTQQCNSIVNHQAQDIVQEESFFSNTSNKDEETLDDQSSARLQSFQTNISTLAAQVDDINNDMSRMNRPEMSFLPTSSGVTLQSINVPLPMNVTSSGSRSDQLDKEDQFENIIRCLQFPDQMQSSSGMSGIDTLESPISNNPSTTTVYINTAAVSNPNFVDSLSSLNNLDHHQQITSSASMHQEEEESGSMYNFQNSLTSNLDVMFSQSPEQQGNDPVLGGDHSRGYTISSASYSSSPSVINSMPSLSVMSSSGSVMSTNGGEISGVSPLIASGLSESAVPGEIIQQQMVLQNSTPKRVRQRLIEFADGTQQIIQYESPIQDVLPNINTQGHQQSPQFIVQGAGTSGQPVQYLAGGSSGQSSQFNTGGRTTSVQLVGNQLISGGQVLQHSDFYKDHSQYLNVDGRIIKGILAYGDDGNQYVIPDKNAGGDLQPFQVVQGSKKPSRALKMVKRVKRQNQQALRQQQIIQQQQLQQRIVCQPQSKSQRARHQMRNQHQPQQTIQITIPERERNISLEPDLLQSVVDMSGLADSIMEPSDIIHHNSMSQGEVQQIQLDVSSPRSYMNSVLGETLTPPKKLFATSSRKRQVSITQTTSTVIPVVSADMAACIPDTPVAIGKGKFTILESKDKPLNGVREKNAALSSIPQQAQVQVQVSEALTIQLPSSSNENHEQQNMFPDTTTNDSSLPAYQDNYKDEHKEMLESLQLDDTTSITTSQDNNHDIVSRKDLDEQPTNVSIESRGRTVARVAPFSVAGEQGEPSEPTVHPQPEPEVECDLEVITYIQVHSKLANQLKDSSEPRRVSSHKCQNVNHAILGRAGSSMHWWEVQVSRGERKHLYLTFDNPGIKLFFEESAIKDMNTALQYFNKDSQKEEDSLDISLCVSCVSWAEKKATKLKNSFQDDTITILKDIREIRPKNLVNYSTLESTNHNELDENDSEGEESIDDSTAAFTNGEDKNLPKKRGRKRGRTDNSPVNVYKKVYWHSREGLENDLDLEIQRKPRKPRKQLFDLFCEFPGCNKKYKSYVILRSHVLKHHSGIYSSPSASSGTPGSDIQKTPGSDPQTPGPQISPGDNQQSIPDGQAHQKIRTEHQTPSDFEGQHQIQHDEREPALYQNMETLTSQNKEDNANNLTPSIANLESLRLPAGEVNVTNLGQDGVPVKKKRGRPRKYPVIEKANNSDHSFVPNQEKRPIKYIKKLKYKKGDVDEDFKPYPLKKKKFKFSSVKESIKEAIFDIERSKESDYDMIRGKDFGADTNKFTNHKPEQAGVKRKRGRPRKVQPVSNINPHESYEDIMRAANPETEVNIVSTNNGNEETIKSIADFIARGNIDVDNSIKNSEYGIAGNEQKSNNVYISIGEDLSKQEYFYSEDYSSKENTILYSIVPQKQITSEENKPKENSIPEKDYILDKEIVPRDYERIKVDEDMIILREDSISRDENDIQKDNDRDKLTGVNKIPKEDYKYKEDNITSDINLAVEDVKSGSKTVADVLNCFELSKTDDHISNPNTPDNEEVADNTKDNTDLKQFAYLSSDNISVPGITRLPKPPEPIANSTSHDQNNDGNLKNGHNAVVKDDVRKKNEIGEEQLDHNQPQSFEVSNACASAIDEQSIKQPKNQQDIDESQILNQNDFKETKKSSRSASIDEIFEEMKIDNTTAVNSMHAEVTDEISGTDDVEAEKVIDSFVVVEVPINKKEIKKWSPKYRKKGGRNLAIDLGKSCSRKKTKGKSPKPRKNESIKTEDQTEMHKRNEIPEEGNKADTNIHGSKIVRKMNKLPRKARKYASENVFPAVKDGSMTAKNAFKQLRLKFEGLTFLGFEKEYRRYFMKEEEEAKLVKPLRIMVEKKNTALNEDSQQNADDPNKLNMADYLDDRSKQDDHQLKQNEDCSKQDSNHSNQNEVPCTKQNGSTSAEVYTTLSAVEEQLKSVLAGRKKIKPEEKLVLKNIDSLIKSFL